MTNKLRIIGGVWRSRQIAFDDAPGLRPTPDRVRETLFNWLQADVVNSCCLDLFAGSGALGFEAASRGAKRVVQVESNIGVCRNLRENVVKLAASQVTVVAMAVERFLLESDERFDLVFLDPPFAQNLAIPACRQLEEGGRLSAHAKIYVETERGSDLSDMPPDWRLLKDKVAGDVRFSLFQRQ